MLKFKVNFSKFCILSGFFLSVAANTAHATIRMAERPRGVCNPKKNNCSGYEQSDCLSHTEQVAPWYWRVFFRSEEVRVCRWLSRDDARRWNGIYEPRGVMPLTAVAHCYHQCRLITNEHQCVGSNLNCTWSVYPPIP